jgi:predicted metal-dependent phosphoesterase TrpH
MPPETLCTILDLHVHAKLTKSEPFKPKRLFSLVDRGRRLGLGGLALTEHFHARGFWEIQEALHRYFPVKNGTFRDGEGFLILAGGEVSLREGSHLLVLIRVEALEELDAAFSRPLTSGYRPYFTELLAAAESHQALVIGAHPFRPQQSLDWAPVSLLRQLDALEVNGRDGRRTCRLREEARALGLPLVGGSDAHHPLQLGARVTLLSGKADGFEAVASAIRHGECGIAGRRWASWWVRLGVYYKRIVKFRRRLAERFSALRQPPPGIPGEALEGVREMVGCAAPGGGRHPDGHGVPGQRQGKAGGRRPPLDLPDGHRPRGGPI